jgi:hypothetical protein
MVHGSSKATGKCRSRESAVYVALRRAAFGGFVARQAEHAPQARRRAWLLPARLHDSGCARALTRSLRWRVAVGGGATPRSAPACARARWSHSSCTHDAVARLLRAGFTNHEYCALEWAVAAWMAAPACLVHALCARRAVAMRTSRRVQRARLVGRLGRLPFRVGTKPTHCGEISGALCAKSAPSDAGRRPSGLGMPRAARGCARAVGHPSGKRKS